MTGTGRRVLVAGIGNVFLGDDGFGVEVASRLARSVLPPTVDVADVGTGGIHLAYELLEGSWGSLVLVDAISRGEAPGTLFVLEPDLGDSSAQPPGGEAPEPGGLRLGAVADGHAMDPVTVLGLLRALGSTPGRVLVVGCEPAEIAEQMALSATVSAVLDEAVGLVASVAAGEAERLASAAPAEVN